MKTQNRPVSLFVPVACAAFVTVAVVGFLFATGRWTGNWLWPILFGVGLLGMMIWAAKVANQPVEQQKPGTWYSYLRRRLQSSLLVALVVIGIFGLTGERVPLYSHMYVFVLSASLASDGLEFVLKAAWRKLRPPKTTT